MAKKVKYYDLQTGLEKWMKEDDELRKFVEEHDLWCPEKNFIVVGKNGVVVSDRFEGVHWVFKDLSEEFKIGLWKKPEKTEHGTSFPSAPSYFLSVSLKEIVEDCEYTEYDVKDMVRKFGKRLDINYGLLLESLGEIGIDLSEYDTNR